MKPDHPDQHTGDDTARMNLSAGVASAVVALILIALKLWAFVATGALSVAASLTDSAMDLMMSLGALTAIVYAARPPDEDHAFGHSSAEDLAALGQSVVIAAAGTAIAAGAVARFLAPQPERLSAHGWGIGVMVVSVVLTLGLVVWQGHVARRTGSRVVAADRLHYLGDLLPGLGAIAALWASSALGIDWLDSVVALIAAGVLLTGATRIGKGAWDALMDRRADPQLLARVTRLIESWPGVRGYHDLRSRTAGSRVFVSVHLELDGDQSLASAHDIGAALRQAIMERYPHVEMIVHKDVAERTPPTAQDDAGT